MEDSLFMYWDPKKQIAIQVCAEVGEFGRCLRPINHSSPCHMSQYGDVWLSECCPKCGAVLKPCNDCIPKIR